MKGFELLLQGIGKRLINEAGSSVLLFKYLY